MTIENQFDVLMIKDNTGLGIPLCREDVSRVSINTLLNFSQIILTRDSSLRWKFPDRKIKITDAKDRSRLSVWIDGWDMTQDVTPEEDKLLDDLFDPLVLLDPPQKPRDRAPVMR